MILGICIAVLFCSGHDPASLYSWIINAARALLRQEGLVFWGDNRVCGIKRLQNIEKHIP
jgi:hypothetical protein